MEQYDLIVIGGGPSGYAGAMRAIDFGKKVLLIEKRRLGGAGVYDGVLTSKTLWEQALKTAAIREMIPEYKVSIEHVKKVVDEAVYERKTQNIQCVLAFSKRRSSRAALAADFAALLKKTLSEA